MIDFQNANYVKLDQIDYGEVMRPVDPSSSRANRVMWRSRGSATTSS